MFFILLLIKSQRKQEFNLKKEMVSWLINILISKKKKEKVKLKAVIKIMFKSLESKDADIVDSDISAAKQQRLKQLNPENLALFAKKEKKKKMDLNLTLENIKKKYLFPFGISEDDCMGTLFTKKAGGIQPKNINFLETNEFEFPLIELSQKQEIISELQSPLTLSVDEIIKSLSRFAKEFPLWSIPHVNENGIIKDSIHRPLKKTDELLGTDNNPNQGPTDIYSEIGQQKNQIIPNIHINDINQIFTHVKSTLFARLVGLLVHFIYWNVFGHINQLPIDNYHRRQLFLTIQKIMSEIEGKINIGKVFTVFSMPMVILALRVQADIIYRNSYPLLYSKKHYAEIASKKINLLITKLFDPNLFYSRFSFLESGKEAIDIKYRQNLFTNGPKLRNKYYTCSSLVSTLLPEPSEGKIRALFTRKNIPKADSKVFANAAKQLIKNKLSTQEQTQYDELTKADDMLKMINKLQLYQVALNKVNTNFKKRKLKPIFNLQQNE